MPDAFYPAYLTYLAFVFLPGVGLGELLGVWKAEHTFGERLGLVFGLGISVDAIALFVRTSGISFLGYRLTGVDSASVYAVIVFGAAALAASLVVRREFLLPKRLERSDFLVFAFLGIQGLMLLNYYSVFPIFPQYPSGDFVQHVILTTTLASPAGLSAPSGILYFGVHYQLAAALVLVSGEPLITVRYTMALLVLFSGLLVYVAASSIFSDRKASVFALLVYSLSATIWFGMIYNAGLYANFYGMLASLFLIAAFSQIRFNKSMGTWLFFVVALLNAYLSHYSTVTLFVALLILPALQLLFGRAGVRGVLYPVALAVIPGILVVPAYPDIISILLSGATQANTTGLSVVGNTWLGSSLAPWPVLSYIATAVTDDLATVLILLFAAVYLYRIRGSRNVMSFLPVVWLVILLGAAPFNATAFRFAFEALVPLSLMASFGAASFIPQLTSQKVQRKTGRSSGRGRIVVVLLLTVSPILIGSWGQTMVQIQAVNGPQFPQFQQFVYQGIYWLKNNSPNRTVSYSVSDWRFTYTILVGDRRTFYQYTADPVQALSVANQVKAEYVIVTNYVTEYLPQNPLAYPWNTFPGSTNMTLVYDNPDVKIFKV